MSDNKEMENMFIHYGQSANKRLKFPKKLVMVILFFVVHSLIFAAIVYNLSDVVNSRRPILAYNACQDERSAARDAAQTAYVFAYIDSISSEPPGMEPINLKVLRERYEDTEKMLALSTKPISDGGCPGMREK